MKAQYSFWIALLTASLLMSACKRRVMETVLDPNRPRRQQTEYFDAKYLLYKLPADYYKDKKLNHSFDSLPGNFLSLEPLGYETSLNLQYTHVYSPHCPYRRNDSIWKFAEVCFPNTCPVRKAKAYAEVNLKNPGGQDKTYWLRLFYQNTTYWYPTDNAINRQRGDYLDNYYGMSQVIKVTLHAGADTLVKIPYSIGMNPKDEFGWFADKDPARAGNYEFMALALPDEGDLLMKPDLDLMKVNPFATVKMDQLENGGKKYCQYAAYTPPNHFKFVFLDEYFDGVNDITPNHIYIPKEGKEKRLCDTCTGWYRAVINENWLPDAFFKGFISQAPYVKADYGIRRKNCRIDEDGITITIPRSTPRDYQKTWGEFFFGQGFKYGHLTLRAKFAKMTNPSGTPNGIIHNLWLYQRDFDSVDVTNPYSYLRNSQGLQPYEIDFEFWNSEEGINSQWDDSAFINYSIVDYMRDAHVQVKPGEKKQMDGYQVNRLNNRQLNIPGQGLPPEFFDSFHNYELYWYPDYVEFKVDGVEKAKITKDMASIPNKYLFLWVGSPLYQDGTYYAQSSIPFLESDKKTIIDYIRID